MLILLDLTQVNVEQVIRILWATFRLRMELCGEDWPRLVNNAFVRAIIDVDEV